MLKNLFNDLVEIFTRQHFYLYDFFDGTHQAPWALRYLLGEFRKEWVSRYEKAISQFTGVPHAVTFGTGRMAFFAILEALEIGPGDEVIIPAFTCVVVPNAILYRQAKPVYVDIDKKTFNIDVSCLESAITPQTKAILAQHTFGQPCDIAAIMSLSKKHSLAVIEDCSHAFGGRLEGRPLGSFGEVAFASSDHTKVLSTSTGGFAYTASQALAERIRRAQRRSPSLPWHNRLQIFFQYPFLTWLNHPRLRWFGQYVINYSWRLKIWFYFQDEMQTSKPERYPVQLSSFQAFVGWHEIQRLQMNIEHRRQIAQALRLILEKSSEPLGDGAYLRYSLLVDSPRAWEKKLGRYFVVGRWFSSVTHGRDTNLEAVCYRRGSCPVAEFVTAHIINFPTHFFMNNMALERLRHLIQRTGENG